MVNIYINFVEPKYLNMLHAKFQDHRTIGFGGKVLNDFTIYGRGSHLGHMTYTIYINFHRPRRLHAIKI